MRSINEDGRMAGWTGRYPGVERPFSSLYLNRPIEVSLCCISGLFFVTFFYSGALRVHSMNWTFELTFLSSCDFFYTARKD